MAYTTTTNYGLKKGSGGSGQTFEQQRVYDNENADTIDSTMKTISNAANAAQSDADTAQATANTAQGEVDALENLVSTISDDLDSRTVILSDLTFNSAWKGGTASVSTVTGLITLTSHGFIDNQPIEFGNGTGALPTGISKYDIDTKGGEYYYVKYVDANTFYVSLTRAGTTVIPTTDGLEGWQIRSAFVVQADNPITLANTDYKNIQILLSGGVVTGWSTVADVSYLGISSTDRQVFRGGTQWGNIIDAAIPAPSSLSSLGKYNFKNEIVTFDIVGKDTFINIKNNIFHSNDKSSGTLSSESLACMVRFLSITKIYFTNTNAESGLRNGTRIVITGRN